MKKANTVIDVKEGVLIKGLTLEMLDAIKVIIVVFKIYTDVKPVITSGWEKAKGRDFDSWHYVGQAVDIRTNYLTVREKSDVFYALKKALGPDYYVKMKQDHIHIEHDPESAKHKHG